MLARANRLVTPDEFRQVSRRGRRVTTEGLVVSSLATTEDRPSRFGFVITRKVGNAVHRNRLRRQLRALAWSHVDSGFGGTDVVVRVLPAAAGTDWCSLSRQFDSAITRKVS